MDERHRKILITSVTCDKYMDFWNKFNKCKLIIEDENFYDYSLLRIALIRKEPAIANFLLKAGCRVRNPNKINAEEAPLHLAMKLNNKSVIRRILKNGASLYDKNCKGETPLYAAFKEMNYFSIDIVLNYYSSKKFQQLNLLNLNPANKDDVLHFHIACVRNNLKAVKLYLKCGFDVNSPFSLDSAEYIGLYPLQYAAIKKHTKMFECLLQYGADISIKNGRGQTSLHIIYFSALFGKHHDMIRHVFKYGNSTKFINSTDRNGVSHFHMCCTLNYPDLVKVFIDNGVDVNSAVSSTCFKYPGFTPLHFAVLFNCEKVVKLLLENGADCNKKDITGITPLHVACSLSSRRAAKFTIIKMLLDYKASATAVDEKRCTPLHTAFYNFDYDETKIFDMLISKIPREVNFTDNEGLSHFHIICTKNDVNRVEDFLKSGIVIDRCVESYFGIFGGYTALHFAVSYNQKDVVEILLKWNAQINKTNNVHFTPLHIACNYFDLQFHGKKDNVDDWTSKLKSQIDVIKLLLLHGADVDAQDTFGKTPLLYICTSDSMRSYVNLFKCIDLYKVNIILKEIIQILLLNKADVNARTCRQKSILHIICENSYLMDAEELVEFLINNGADIHAADDAGLTPLHLAVKSRNKKFVQIFLKHKANVNAKSKNFQIPLNLLLQSVIIEFSSEEKDIFLLLLENGSDVNVRIENGETLWLDAIKHRMIFILEQLLNYGADINMENSIGEPLIVSTLTTWQFKTVNWINELNATVFHIIFTHVQKLLAIGFYVNEKVQKCCFKLHQYYKAVLSDNNEILNLDSIYNDCVEELNRMKCIKINNYTSLYSILLKNTHELSKFVRNSTLINILEDQNIRDNFPLYSYLLKMQFKKGLIRSDALKSANALLSSVIGINLPDPCYDSILKYLTNEEIAKLQNKE